MPSLVIGATMGVGYSSGPDISMWLATVLGITAGIAAGVAVGIAANNGIAIGVSVATVAGFVFVAGAVGHIYASEARFSGAEFTPEFVFYVGLGVVLGLSLGTGLLPGFVLVVIMGVGAAIGVAAATEVEYMAALVRGFNYVTGGFTDVYAATTLVATIATALATKLGYLVATNSEEDGEGA